MVLGFKTTINGKPTGFPEKILSGSKIHTIRAGNRWKPGMKIHPATGVRTKNYKMITPMPLECKSVQEIDIVHFSNKQKVVLIDGIFGYNTMMPSDMKVIETIAKNDGFDSVEDFFAWFDEDFNGQLIHWTDAKY